MRRKIFFFKGFAVFWSFAKRDVEDRFFVLQCFCCFWYFAKQAEEVCDNFLYTRKRRKSSSNFMITLRQRFYVGDQTEEKEKDNVLLNQFQCKKILHPRIGLLFWLLLSQESAPHHALFHSIHILHKTTYMHQCWTNYPSQQGSKHSIFDKVLSQLVSHWHERTMRGPWSNKNMRQIRNISSETNICNFPIS